MKKYLNILKKCPLFFNIDDESLLRMLTCLGAKIEYFDKKYTIFANNCVPALLPEIKVQYTQN